MPDAEQSLPFTPPEPPAAVLDLRAVRERLHQRARRRGVLRAGSVMAAVLLVLVGVPRVVVDRQPVELAGGDAQVTGLPAPLPAGYAVCDQPAGR